MKNYTLDKNAEFILGYKVKNNKIYIKYANKRKKGVVSHSKDKEEMILAKMEDQVLSKKTEKFKKRYMEEGSRNISGFITMFFSTSFALSCSILVYVNPIFLIPIALGVIGSDIVLGIYTYSPFIKINDIKKNKFFLENKREINEGIKENEHDLTNILVSTNKKTRKIVTECRGKEVPFDINVIDSLSYSELVKLRDNIRQDKSFTEQQEQLEKNQEMVKK